MSHNIDVELSVNTQGIYDISVGGDGDLSLVDGFDTAVLMSILCERRADPSEVQNVLRRRGWVGNQYADVPGFEIGSKIWLYEQSRMGNDTLNGIKSASLDALQWLVDDEYVIRNEATITNRNDEAVLIITIEPSSGIVEQRYFTLWENTGNAA